MAAVSEVETSTSISVEVDTALTELERGLGSFCYRWLIACAVYPVLRLPITLQLGAALKRADGKGDPTEEEVLALCSLPWFRQGWIPEAWRRILLTAQASEDRLTVRNALADLAHTLIDANGADARGAVTVVRVSQAPPNFAKDWAMWRAGLPAVLAPRDASLEAIAPIQTTRRDAMILGWGAALGVAGMSAGLFVSSHLEKVPIPRIIDQRSTTVAALDRRGGFAAIARDDGRITVASTDSQSQIRLTVNAAPTLALGFDDRNLVMVTSDGIQTWCPDCSGGNEHRLISRQGIVEAQVAAEGGAVLYLAADGPRKFSAFLFRDGKSVSLNVDALSASSERPLIALSPSGRFLAIVASSTLSIFDASNSMTGKTGVSAESPPKYLAVSDGRDGPLVAYADTQGVIYAGPGITQFGRFDARMGPVSFLSVAARPGIIAPLVIAGARDGQIAVQSPDRIILAGHKGPILAACFSDDFKLLATGSQDGTARLWVLADGRSMVLPSSAPVLEVAFVPQEQILITLSADGVARRWEYESIDEASTKKG